MEEWDGNWLGKTWMKDHNNDKLPSLNQISNGLVDEAMVKLNQAMGKVNDQKSAFEAQENIKKTWEDLLGKAKIEDRDAVLEFDS